jgi:MFS transporter, PAT family, beta-lactamase induction signal transducer AmpG
MSDAVPIQSDFKPPRPTYKMMWMMLKGIISNDKRLLGLMIVGIGAGSTRGFAEPFNFFLRESGLPLSTIGLIGSVGLLSVLSFLWAPFLDRSLKALESRLGYRRSMLIPINFMAVASMVAFSFTDPQDNLVTLTVAYMFFMLFVASQEIVQQAHRIDATPGPLLPVGVSLAHAGARLGDLIISAGVLIIAEYISWQAGFLFFAAIQSLVTIGSLVLGERGVKVERNAEEQRFGRRLGDPFRNLFTRKGVLWVLLFLIVHKLGDGMANAMSRPFLVDAGYTKTQVSLGGAIVGTVGALAGIILGMWLYQKMSERAGMFWAMVVAMISNIGFVWLSLQKANLLYLSIVMFIENVAGAAGTVLLLSLITRMCDRKFAATQFQLIVAMMMVGSILLTAPAGFYAERIGYTAFFIVTMLVFLPGFAIWTYLCKLDLLSKDRPKGMPSMKMD